MNISFTISGAVSPALDLLNAFKIGKSRLKFCCLEISFADFAQSFSGLFWHFVWRVEPRLLPR